MVTDRFLDLKALRLNPWMKYQFKTMIIKIITH